MIVNISPDRWFIRVDWGETQAMADRKARERRVAIWEERQSARR
jgi:sarcosine oxidase gamma subunit